MAGRGRPIKPAKDLQDEWSSDPFEVQQQGGSWDEMSQAASGLVGDNNEFSGSGGQAGDKSKDKWESVDGLHGQGSAHAGFGKSSRGGFDSQDKNTDVPSRGGFCKPPSGGDVFGHSHTDNREGGGGFRGSRVGFNSRTQGGFGSRDTSLSAYSNEVETLHNRGFGTNRGRGGGFSANRANQEYSNQAGPGERYEGQNDRNSGAFRSENTHGGFGGNHSGSNGVEFGGGGGREEFRKGNFCSGNYERSQPTTSNVQNKEFYHSSLGRDGGERLNASRERGFGVIRGRGGGFQQSDNSEEFCSQQSENARDSGYRGNGRGRGGFGASRSGFNVHDGSISDRSEGGFQNRSEGGFQNRSGAGGFQNRDEGGGFSARSDKNSASNFRGRGAVTGGRGGGCFRGVGDQRGSDAFGTECDYLSAPISNGRISQKERMARDETGGSVCYKCQQPGHFARECPNQNARVCFKCNKPGHISSACPNAKDDSNEPAARSHIPEEIQLDEIYQRTVHKGINFDRYDSISVEVSGSNRPGVITTFSEIQLPSVMLENVQKNFKYSNLLPVQKYAIPIVLEGRDLMACAQTGSGKTAAFILPLAKLITSTIESSTSESQYTHFPSVLVLVPTRELCDQTFKFGTGFLSGTSIKIQRIYGGPKTDYLRNELTSGCHILVATPGRLKDFVERRYISLNKTKHLVLDEADQMLDRGFLGDVTWTLDQMPLERQILMFSATFPPAIQTLAQQYLQNYLFLTVGQVGAANPDVTQEVREIPEHEKQAALETVIKEWQSNPAKKNDRMIIFVETKRQTDFIGLLLTEKNKLPCTTIHGDRLQREREIAMRDFQRGVRPILVATNVASRGLDISNVELVINMDLPKEFDMYVHRIGRTGRCGNPGRSISFYDHSRDSALALPLRQALEKSGQPVPAWLDVYADQSGGVDYSGGYGRGGSRDLRRGVDRDRFQEGRNLDEFADNNFTPAAPAAAAANLLADEEWG